MSTRWFFSSARLGAAASATGQALPTSVLFGRDIDGRHTQEPVPGPTLSLVGPGDVLGFDRMMVLREEPPPGTAQAAENIMASVELAHADLPWLLSPGVAATPSGPTPQPWIVLVVLAEDEAAPPRDANPLPVLTAPSAALPPLAERWAWAHLEARLPDDVTDIGTAQRLAEQGVRTHSAEVVGRLVCPRRLEPDRGWIAAVVPATAAGRAAGLNADSAAAGTGDAWQVGGPGTVDLPVYHWWTFRTGAEGTFEELARRLRFHPAADAGLGTRTIDVSRPWPAEPPTGPATVAVDGALQVPGATAPEVWSDPAAQDGFRALLRERLDAPARRRDEARQRDENGQPAEDRDTVAVAAPLYGSHHTGQQTVPTEPDGWMSTLNLEVRRRVAAALGARYVQQEQEFLMARAWEQVGEIRRANRLLAVSELAAAAAEQAQRKHLGPLGVSDLVTVMAPVGDRVAVSVPAPVETPTTLTATLTTATLAAMLATSPVPTGAASTSFVRLTRRSGALARRVGRIAVPGAPGLAATKPVIEQGLSEMGGGEQSPEVELPDELRAGISPPRLQLLRMTDRLPAGFWAQRSEAEARPLRPIMAHPKFSVPIAGELLARWPEWAIPGIGALPPDSVTLLKTNPEFVAALLVGLNHEFNRELLWREFPTDQRGTPFARFWPGDDTDIDEIALWPLDTPLGSRLRGGGEGSLAVLVRGELLHRFPGTALLAVRGENGRLPEAFGGVPGTPLALDESTVLYLFAGLDEERAIAEDWFFVFREPMHGTQFGFDSGVQPARMSSWADLTWAGVTVDAARFVRLSPGPPAPQPLPTDPPPPPDPPVWGRDAADTARIAFQQPFQLAFPASTLLAN